MAAAYRASEDEWERQSECFGTSAAVSPPPLPCRMCLLTLSGGTTWLFHPAFRWQLPYGYPSFPGGPMPALGQPGMPFGGSPQFVTAHTFRVNRLQAFRTSSLSLKPPSGT